MTEIHQAMWSLLTNTIPHVRTIMYLVTPATEASTMAVGHSSKIFGSGENGLQLTDDSVTRLKNECVENDPNVFLSYVPFLNDKAVDANVLCAFQMAPTSLHAYSSECELYRSVPPFLVNTCFHQHGPVLGGIRANLGSRRENAPQHDVHNELGNRGGRGEVVQPSRVVVRGFQMVQGAVGIGGIWKGVRAFGGVQTG